MKIYSFDVTVSDHDSIKAGVIATRVNGSQHRHHRIVIADDNWVEASLTAAMMASEHGVVTAVYHRI